MITVCFARALQRCTSRIYMHFLLTFQEVMPISKTRNQLQRKRIEEAKAALSSECLVHLYEEAQRLIRQENPNIRFGENILIQLKLDELIWDRYLSKTPGK